MRNKASKNRKERLLIELEQYTEKHLDLAKSVLQAANSQLYVLDFLAVGAIHRSINLIKGFCDFVKSNNFICASSLLRLQLDTCLRFFASFLVDDPHKFAFNLMKGKHVNKQKDKCGKLMTDSYLAKKLSEIHPWVTKLYKQASGYIHLSEMHIFNVIRAKSDEEISAELIIGEGDSFVSDND